MVKNKKASKSSGKESDSSYVLKLVIYMILGSSWLKIAEANPAAAIPFQIPIPIGFIAGLMLISRERVRVDKKIDYAVLLIAMLVGFWAPVGIFVNV